MGRWVFFGALLIAPSVVAAQAPSTDTVRRALSTYEGGPGPAFWRELGPNTLAVLVELYNDGDQPPFVRLRSVAAAAHYPGPGTRAFLVAVANAREQPELFVREAIMALSRAFGPSATEDVARFADHPRDLVREAVVQALVSDPSPRARQLLRHRLLGERVERVRIRIRAALSLTP